MTIATITLNLINGVSRVLREIGGGLGQLNQQFGSLNQTIELFGKGLSAVASGFGLGPALAEAGRFEDALAAVQAVTGATAEEFDLLKAAAEKAGQTTTFSSVQAAEGLTELARAGFDARGAIETLNPVLQLAQGQQLSVADAARFATTTLTQFGLAATDAGRVADVLASTADKTQTSVQLMGLSLSYAAPLAKSLGLSLEETSAIIGKLADEGFRGERSGTALRNVFSKLLDPASKFAVALRDAGIQSTNFIEVITQLAEKGEAGRKALTALDAESRPAILALVNKGGAGLRELTAELENSAGAAERTALILGSTFNASVTQLTNSLGVARDAFLEPLLQPLADELRAMSLQITEFIKTADFAILRDQFKTFVLDAVTAFKEFAAQIDFKVLTADVIEFGRSAGEAFKGIASFAGDAGKALAGLGENSFFLALKTGFNVLTGDIDEATVSAERLSANFNAMPANITPATNSIVALGIAGVLTGRDVSGAISEIVAAELGLKTSTTETTTVMADGYRAAVTAVGELVTAAVEASTPIAEGTAGIQAAFVALGEGVVVATSQFGEAGQAARNIGQTFLDIGKSAVEGAKESRKAFVDIARDANSSADDIRAAFKDALNAATTIEDAQRLQNALGRLGKDSKITGAELNQAFVQVGNKIKELGVDANDLGQALKDAFKDLGVISKQQLQEAADKSQKSFDLIVAAARKGQASVDDVAAAFVALARKQLAVVENASAQEKAQVEGMIRAKAAALGLTDALDEIGIAGQKAGAEVASGAAQAASALSQVASAASSAAGSVSDLGAASSEASSGLREVGSSATATSGELTQFSSATQGAVKSQLGAITAYERGLEVQRLQQESFDREKRQLGALTDSYDPLKQQLDDLARKYPNVSEAARRSLAEQRAGIQDLGQSIADVQAQVTQNTSSVGSPTGLQGNGLTNQGPGQIAPPVTGNFVPPQPSFQQAPAAQQNVTFNAIVATDRDLEELVRRAAPFIRKLNSRI